MLFKKNPPKLTESPLNYWEEESYMLVLLPNEDEDIIRESLERISSINEVKVIENNYSVKENVFYLKIEYEKEEYEVGFYFSGFSIPEYYLNQNLTFSAEEKEKILKVQKALTIFMKFNKSIQKSYQLQLKLAIAMVPDLLGVLDESAEKMLPAKWVKMISESKVLPSPESLFSIQAVTDDKETWLHTHGLNRCGLTELEILQSDPKNSNNHYNIVSTYATYLIDKEGDFDAQNEGAYIGCLINGDPIVVTCRSWTEGILEYKNAKLGNLKDRQNGHNSKTSIIFLYTSEENEKEKVLTKVSVYNELWGNNPLFFFSDKETKRMKELAIEKYEYIKEGFKNKENTVLIKIGLPLKEKDKFEHIWFELLEIKGDKFKAKLTQEPYDVKDKHKGDIDWYTKEDITDWVIYTKTIAINPENTYLLEK